MENMNYKVVKGTERDGIIREIKGLEPDEAQVIAELWASADSDLTVVVYNSNDDAIWVREEYRLLKMRERCEN